MRMSVISRGQSQRCGIRGGNLRVAKPECPLELPLLGTLAVAAGRLLGALIECMVVWGCCKWLCYLGVNVKGGMCFRVEMQIELEISVVLYAEIIIC